MKSPQPDLVLHTDASLLGWGATCQGIQIGGAWTKKELNLHINCLELLGAWNAVQSFCPTQNQSCGSHMDGQFQCSDIHQPHGRNTVNSAGRDSHTVLDMGSSTMDYSQSTAHSRCAECHGRQDVSNNCQRQVGLEVESSNLLQNIIPVGSTTCRHVCDKTINPSPSLFFVETRASSGSYRCLSSGLVSNSRIRSPSLVSHSTLPEEGCTTKSNIGDDNPPLVNSELVSNNSLSLHRLSTADSAISRPTATHRQRRCPISQSSHPTGRLAYLGQSLRNRGVSAEAEELIFSAWRGSTNKNYDSAWKKWESWCSDRNVNPISASIESVLSFLASQFHKGHQYRSLNIYRSAISSAHPRIDGFEIGKHPLVTRLMKGVFNKRPPLPKYSTTWSVGTVLTYSGSLGNNSDMSLKDLSHKLATLLALVTAGRSSDLVLLSVNHFTSTLEGLKFTLSGLSKQSRPNHMRPNHMRPPIRIQKYGEDSLLCPVECFMAYVARTNQFRSRDSQGLFSVISGYIPATCSYKSL